MITVISKLLIFFSHTHTHKFINSAFFFRIFFPIKPTQRGFLSDSQKHKIPQSILYMDCYLSQEHQKIAQIQVSKPLISSPVYIKTTKTSLILKIERCVSLGPLNKTFTLSAPHNGYPYTQYKQKIQITPKNLVCFEQDYQSIVGEEGTMGYRSFHFIFNNVRLFIFSAEQNTKEIMKLFQEDDVIFS